MVSGLVNSGMVSAPMQYSCGRQLWQFGYDFQSFALKLVWVPGIARDINAQIKLRLHYKDQSVDSVSGNNLCSI
jgi:hypothetical protein